MLCMSEPKRRQVLPVDFPDCKLWLRSDLGITLVADPVIAAWTLDAGWTSMGGGLYAHAGAVDHIFQNILVIGNTYEVTYTVSGVAGGATVRPYAGTTAGTLRNADGTYTETLLCAANVAIVFEGTGTVSVSGVSIKSRSCSAWADQSGLGHHVVQANAFSQPTYVFGGGGPASLPYVLFDGVADVLSVPDHADFDVGNGSWACLMALQSVSGGAVYHCYWGKAWGGAGNGVRGFHTNTGKMSVFWGTDAQAYPVALVATMADGADCVATWGHDAVASQVVYRHNGVEERRAAASAGTGSNAEPLVIGASSNGVAYITNFRLYELAFYKYNAAVVPSANLAMLEQWWRARYGI